LEIWDLVQNLSLCKARWIMKDEIFIEASLKVTMLAQRACVDYEENEACWYWPWESGPKLTMCEARRIAKDNNF
jgi:hypothetical protein